MSPCANKGQYRFITSLNPYIPNIIIFKVPVAPVHAKNIGQNVKIGQIV